MHWQPSPTEFTAPMVQPRPWDIALGPFGKGIDNAHIDCLLSARFREQAGETVRKLVREDAAGLLRRIPEQMVGSDDLAAFRDTYLGLFEGALDGRRLGKDSRNAVVLLQFTLLKYLLQLVAREVHSLQDEIKAQMRCEPALDGIDRTGLGAKLVLVTRHAQDIQRRVADLLFRQVRKLESTQVQTLRSSVLGTHWPVPEAVLFNPLLRIPDPTEGLALAVDYPVARLAESGRTDWLARTAECLSQTFASYLPEWFPSEPRPQRREGERPPAPAERRDQGELRGFLATEILLDQFVPRVEYRQGLTTWLDEPTNLRLLLDSGAPLGDGPGGRSAQGTAIRWQHLDWPRFHRDLLSRLGKRLDATGLHGAIECAYALPGLCRQLGYTLPLPLVLDYTEDRLSRRRLTDRLVALHGRLDPLAVYEALERLRDARRARNPEEQQSLLARYFVDFLTLRRDLKLAYKTFEVLDGIRLLEGEDERRLSRTNGSLYEFHCHGEVIHQTRLIRTHAVLKADVRGSTAITEGLRARGLNPASHFSLNFFNPVNTLLPEFQAEKLFVEGDAVILALYEYADDGPGLAVSRACRLARKILRIVTLKNVQNRQLGLPELELGLGISFSRSEPNFLYDEGRPIMISNAINQADRLSSCSALLVRSGFVPAHPSFRVAVVRDAIGGERAGPGRDLLNYNVNGVKLDEAAFLKLQEELPMRPLRLPVREATESLYFIGSHRDDNGRAHWIVLRHAPVYDWYGDAVGPVEPERRHYFELIVDEPAAAQIRRLAAGGSIDTPAQLDRPMVDPP